MRFLLPGSSSFVSDDWKESVADFGKCSFAFWLSSRSSSASWLNWWCRAQQARVVRVMKIAYKKLCSSTYRSFPNITFFSKICVKNWGPSLLYTRVGQVLHFLTGAYFFNWFSSSMYSSYMGTIKDQRTA